MGFTFKVETKKTTALIKRLENLDGIEVDAGFFEEDRYGADNSNLHVATVAAYNNFGTRFNPRRPFMDETFEDGTNQIFMGKAMSKIFESTIRDGRATRRLLRGMGELVAELIKIEILNYPGSNSPATIARKGKNTPLRDTEFMLESVKFQIK